MFPGRGSIASPALRRGGANATATTLMLRCRLLAICWGSLAVAVASATLWLLLLSASITGAPFGRALSDGTAATVLTRTRFGHNWLVRSALALMLAAALVSFGRGHNARDAREAAAVRSGDPEPLSNATATMLAVCFVGTLAWAGHCGAIPGVAGGAQVAADFLHLSAAAAWFGALVPLSMFLAAAADTREPDWVDIAREALARFSTMGTLAVATIVATGAANAWALVGSSPRPDRDALWARAAAEGGALRVDACAGCGEPVSTGAAPGCAHRRRARVRSRFGRSQPDAPPAEKQFARGLVGQRHFGRRRGTRNDDARCGDALTSAFFRKRRREDR